MNIKSRISYFFSKLWDPEDNLLVFGASLWLFFVFSAWDTYEILAGLKPYYGTLVGTPSVLSETYGWLPLALGVSHGNLFPSMPSVFAHASELRFYPYISIWIHGLLVAVFGVGGATWIGHTVFPIFCFWLTYSIFRKSVSKSWSAGLGFLALICFVPLPFRGFLLGLLRGDGINQITTLQPLELSHFPFPALSLLFFLCCFHLSISKTKLDWRRISMVTLLWAIQSQVHPYNAVVGLIFWFLVFPIRVFRQTAREDEGSALPNMIRLVLTQLLIVFVICLPSMVAYKTMLSSAGIQLINFGVITDKQGFLFHQFYGLAYFVAPLLMSFLIYFVFRFDFYEFIYRFWPAFVLLGIETVTLLANMLFHKSIAPALIFSRLGIFFLHFYYLIPAIYFLSTKIATLRSRREARLIQNLRKGIGMVFNKAQLVYLPVLMLALTLFAIMSAQRHHELIKNIDKPSLEIAWKEIHELENQTDPETGLVSTTPGTNILLTIADRNPGLFVNRFSNNVSEQEITERLALYARLAGWPIADFVRFMSPGRMQTNSVYQENDPPIQLLGHDIIESGFGYWLALHNKTITSAQVLSEYNENIRTIYTQINISVSLKKFNISKVLSKDENQTELLEAGYEKTKSDSGWLYTPKRKI